MRTAPSRPLTLIAFKIEHALPGRVRLILPEVRRQAARMEWMAHALSALPGVLLSRGNALTGSLLIQFDPSKINLGRILIVLSDAKDHPVVERVAPDRTASEKRSEAELSIKRQFRNVLISGGILGFLVFGRFFGAAAVAAGAAPIFGLASIAAILFGIPIFKEGLHDMIEHKNLSLDLLVSLAAIVAITLGEGLTALEVVWLMNIGTLLEDYTEERSRRAIEKLLEVGQKEVWIIVNGVELQVPIETVKPEDLVVVRTGERIPVDGAVQSGEAAVNQASITGESLPVSKSKGDSVFAGTLVDNGTLHIKATKIGDETYLARVLHMVEESLEKRAPVESISDRFSAYFVPSAVAVSLLTFLVTRNFYRAMTVLVTACPCAASIATPTAITAAIGNAARRNILIKGGIYVEEASQIDAVCFDKTGTVTMGKPAVATVVPLSDGYSEKEILALAASAELHSNHPLAQALISSARERGITVPEHESCEVKVGKGIRAVFQDGTVVLVGSRRLLEEFKVKSNGNPPEVDALRERGETLLYVAKGDQPIGLIGVTDQLRPEAAEAVRRLKEEGVELVLLTGDHELTARAIGKALGVDHVHYDLLPEDKAAHIEEMRRQGKQVAMVGDGVNDAVALAKSNLGIAIGAGGSDVAVETADIALADNDIRKIPEIIDLSRTTLRIIKQNYAFSIGLNSAGVLLGALGRISPFMGGVIHVVNSLGVILNSSRILQIQDRR